MITSLLIFTDTGESSGTMLLGKNYDDVFKILTVRCTVVQSSVLRLHVVRPSVCQSVRPSMTLVAQEHRLEILETNCTD